MFRGLGFSGSMFLGSGFRVWGSGFSRFGVSSSTFLGGRGFWCGVSRSWVRGWVRGGCSRLRVFEFWIRGLGFRGFEFRVSCAGFGVPGFQGSMFRGSGFGLLYGVSEVCGSGLGVSWLGFRGSGFRVLSFWVSGSVFRG